MTKQQVAGMVDRWLERAIAPLLAAVIIGGFIMWGDVKVIKEQMHWMRAETESASRMDAAQNASIRQLNDRLLIIETRNP